MPPPARPPQHPEQAHNDGCITFITAPPQPKQEFPYKFGPDGHLHLTIILVVAFLFLSFWVTWRRKTKGESE